MKKIISLCLLTGIGLIVLGGCSSKNHENSTTGVLYEKDIPSSAQKMSHTFYDGVDVKTVKYECDGDTYVQMTAGSSNYFCDGELVNVGCYLHVEDNEPLDFYHLEEIGCEDLREEHPEVF